MPIRKGGKHGYRFEKPRTKRVGQTRKSPRKTGIPYGIAGKMKALKKKSTIGRSKPKNEGRLAKRALKPRKVKFHGKSIPGRKRMPKPRKR